MKAVLQTLVALTLIFPVLAFAESGTNAEGTFKTEEIEMNTPDALKSEEIEMSTPDAFKSEETEMSTTDALKSEESTSDSQQTNTNPDLVPPAATPGESEQGRTVFTTPEQNEEILEKYEQIQREQEAGASTNDVSSE